MYKEYMRCFFMIVVLNKKRLGITLSILLVSVFVFTFQVAGAKNTVPTVSLPVSNKVIVIDAGHRKTR